MIGYVATAYSPTFRATYIAGVDAPTFFNTCPACPVATCPTTINATIDGTKLTCEIPKSTAVANSDSTTATTAAAPANSGAARALTSVGAAGLGLAAVVGAAL